MQVRVNGKMVEVPRTHEGTIDTAALAASADISGRRAMIVQRADGGNEMLNPYTPLKPGDVILDAPITERG